MKDRRFHYVDAARGIAVLLVIYGHTFRESMRAAYAWCDFSYALVYRFHVSLLFLLSGMGCTLTAQKYDAAKDLCYAKTGGAAVCNKTPNATFAMTRAYSRLKLSIKRHAAYPQKCRMTLRTITYTRMMVRTLFIFCLLWLVKPRICDTLKAKGRAFPVPALCWVTQASKA